MPRTYEIQYEDQFLRPYIRQCDPILSRIGVLDEFNTETGGVSGDNLAERARNKPECLIGYISAVCGAIWMKRTPKFRG